MPKMTNRYAAEDGFETNHIDDLLEHSQIMQPSDEANEEESFSGWLYGSIRDWFGELRDKKLLYPGIAFSATTITIAVLMRLFLADNSKDYSFVLLSALLIFVRYHFQQQGFGYRITHAAQTPTILALLTLIMTQLFDIRDGRIYISSIWEGPSTDWMSSFGSCQKDRVSIGFLPTILFIYGTIWFTTRNREGEISN